MPNHVMLQENKALVQILKRVLTAQALKETSFAAFSLLYLSSDSFSA